MKSVLLLTSEQLQELCYAQPFFVKKPASRSAEHFIKFCLASFHVNVLFKGVEIKQGQSVISCIVGPVRCLNTLIDVARIAEIKEC